MITHSNLNTEMVAISSKDAFDELGEDGANRALGNSNRALPAHQVGGR